LAGVPATLLEWQVRFNLLPLVFSVDHFMNNQLAIVGYPAVTGKSFLL
jgi:hypothetical protein